MMMRHILRCKPSCFSSSPPLLRRQALSNLGIHLPNAVEKNGQMKKKFPDDDIGDEDPDPALVKLMYGDDIQYATDPALAELMYGDDIGDGYPDPAFLELMYGDDIGDEYPDPALVKSNAVKKNGQNDIQHEDPVLAKLMYDDNC